MKKLEGYMAGVNLGGWLSQYLEGNLQRDPEHHFDRFDMAGLAGADLADDTSELALVGQILDDARVVLGEQSVEMELFVAR